MLDYFVDSHKFFCNECIFYIAGKQVDESPITGCLFYEQAPYTFRQLCRWPIAYVKFMFYCVIKDYHS